MSNSTNSPSYQDLIKGLEIVELEQRLEMVHLTAIESEGTTRCDSGGGGETEVPEVQTRLA